MRNLLILCFLSFVAGCGILPLGPSSSSQRSEFELTPAQRNETGVIHSQFDSAWADRIALDRVAMQIFEAEREFSPNDTYWFVTKPSDSRTLDAHSAAIYIYSQRDYLLRMRFFNIGLAEIQSGWINEKLLFVRVPLDEYLGIDWIVDVEREETVYREMLQWTDSAFYRRRQTEHASNE